MSISPQDGYIDANAYSRGRAPVRTRKADPLDHSYHIQSDGDTRRFPDPRTAFIDNTRWRATCDVCPWLGDWHAGREDGPQAADEDGHQHRTSHRGQPGYEPCDGCGTRVFDTALCDRCAQTFEDEQKDPWS